MNEPVPNELISAYFDGEVTPDERGQIENLLESSTELRQWLDDTAKLSALLHSFPRQTPPVDLAANVQERVHAIDVKPATAPAVRKSFRRELMAGVVGMVATMASLVLLAVLMDRSSTAVSSKQASILAPEGLVLHDPLARSAISLQAKSQFDEVPASGELQKSTVEHDLALRVDGAKADAASGVSLDQQAAPMAAAAMPAPVEQNNQEWGVTANSLSDGTIVAAPELVDFLKYLNKGEVFVPQFIDPDNNVAVVEFTVVDIYKGAEEMQLLLQKRSLPQVENAENLDASRDRLREKVAARSMATKKRVAAPDDLLVIFVRAPGEQLVDLLNDSQKNHPDIYKKLKTELPIQLSNNFVDNTSNVVAPLADSMAADTAVPPPAVASKEKESVPDAVATAPQTVAVEANLAVNMYANLRNYVREDDESAQERQSKIMSAARRPRGDADAATKDSPAGKAEQGSSLAKQNSGSEAKSSADKKPDAQANDSSKSSGYAAFQLANASQRPMGRQQASYSAQNSASVPNPVAANQLSTQVIPFNNNSYMMGNSANPLNSGGNFGYVPLQGQMNLRRGSRANNDSRDQRLNRLLIVLRTEQSTPPPGP